MRANIARPIAVMAGPALICARGPIRVASAPEGADSASAPYTVSRSEGGSLPRPEAKPPVRAAYPLSRRRMASRGRALRPASRQAPHEVEYAKLLFQLQRHSFGVFRAQVLE